MFAYRSGYIRASFLSVMLLFALPALAGPRAISSFDDATKTFRLDGGDVFYIFGVNARDELQSVYWGTRLQPGDFRPQVKPNPGRYSFELSQSETQQAFAGWGQGLQWEPALKITFPDGNRDLVLHYVSHRLNPDGVDVMLRDISRDVRMTLHYSIDSPRVILTPLKTIF